MINPSKIAEDMGLKKKPNAELSGSVEEAKKYKSADEFMKAQGEPLYHGTNAKFDEFDTKKIGSTTDDGMWGRGFYFSDKATAKNYGKNIMEVTVDIKKPLVINQFKTIKEASDYMGMSEDSFIITNGIVRPLLSQSNQFSIHAKDL